MKEVWKLQRPLSGPGPVLAYNKGKRREMLIYPTGVGMDAIFEGAAKVYVEAEATDEGTLIVHHRVEPEDW